MGYRHPILEPGADARRDLLAAAVVLGAHLDTPEGKVDDETLVGALSAFMDARECYLASLGARHGITLDSGPPYALAPQRARARAPLRLTARHRTRRAAANVRGRLVRLEAKRGVGTAAEAVALALHESA